MVATSTIPAFCRFELYAGMLSSTCENKYVMKQKMIYKP